MTPGGRRPNQREVPDATPPSAANIVSFEQDGAFEIEIRANAESLIAEIGTEHSDTDDSPNAQIYNRLRELAPHLGRQDELVGISRDLVEGALQLG